MLFLRDIFYLILIPNMAQEKYKNKAAAVAERIVGRAAKKRAKVSANAKKRQKANQTVDDESEEGDEDEEEGDEGEDDSHKESGAESSTTRTVRTTTSTGTETTRSVPGEAVELEAIWSYEHYAKDWQKARKLAWKLTEGQMKLTEGHTIFLKSAVKQKRLEQKQKQEQHQLVSD